MYLYVLLWIYIDIPIAIYKVSRYLYSPSFAQPASQFAQETNYYLTQAPYAHAYAYAYA